MTTATDNAIAKAIPKAVQELAAAMLRHGDVCRILEEALLADVREACESRNTAIYLYEDEPTITLFIPYLLDEMVDIPLSALHFDLQTEEAGLRQQLACTQKFIARFDAIKGQIEDAIAQLAKSQQAAGGSDPKPLLQGIAASVAIADEIDRGGAAPYGFTNVLVVPPGPEALLGPLPADRRVLREHWGPLVFITSAGGEDIPKDCGTVCRKLDADPAESSVTQKQEESASG